MKAEYKGVLTTTLSSKRRKIRQFIHIGGQSGEANTAVQTIRRKAQVGSKTDVRKLDLKKKTVNKWDDTWSRPRAAINKSWDTERNTLGNHKTKHCIKNVENSEVRLNGPDRDDVTVICEWRWIVYLMSCYINHHVLHWQWNKAKNCFIIWIQLLLLLDKLYLFLNNLSKIVSRVGLASSRKLVLLLAQIQRLKRFLNLSTCVWSK